MEIKLHIPLDKNPLSHQSHARGSRFRRYKTKSMMAYQELIFYTAKQEWSGPPLEIGYASNFSLHVHFTLKDKRHGDLDNMSKSVIDALEGVWFENDKYCNDFRATYSFAKKAAIDVTMTINDKI